MVTPGQELKCSDAEIGGCQPFPATDFVGLITFTLRLADKRFNSCAISGGYGETHELSLPWPIFSPL